MKYTFSALLLAASTFAFAGDKNNDYSVSVFRPVQDKFATPETRIAAIEKVKPYFPGFNIHTDRLTGNVNDIYGNAIDIPGSLPLDKSQYCISNMLTAAGINIDEWQVYRDAAAPRAYYVDYRQNINGHIVVFSKLSFRFAHSGQLQRIAIRAYNKPASNTTPAISKNNVVTARSLGENLDDVNITSTEVKGDWVWFPVPGADNYTLHPAWEVLVQGTTGIAHPVKLRCYVDAINGQLLYRTNEVKELFDVTVKGNVYKNNPLSPATLEPLANLVVIENGNTYYTDDAGTLSFPVLNNVNGNYTLFGKWVAVVDYGTNSTPNFFQLLSGTGNTYVFPNTAPSNDRVVNAYYHTNRAHDFMKEYLPGFTDLDAELPANVDITSGSCNAYFDGGSINFYAAGGGCNSYAEIGDIVYHEYGHAISGIFYYGFNFMGMENGALNEGNSDVWAMSINKDGIVGEGAGSMSVNDNIRRYDKFPKVYPTDIIGEVHADGEIIAGVWWDLGQYLNSVDSMTALFSSTYYDLPDGPDGTEGQVYHDVLISALMNDDDDLTLQNGTPHFTEIARAFARHGIYYYGEATFSHTEIANQPSKSAIFMTATLNATDMTSLTGVKALYNDRSGSGWKQAATAGVNGQYTAQIPAQAPGTLIDYYFQAYTIASVPHGIFPRSYDPQLATTAVTIPYQFGVGLIEKLSTDFETALSGWQVGNVAGDDATTGIWVHNTPIGSYTQALSVSQPGNDHTPGIGKTKCLVTGNAPSSASDVGEADVDNGTTSVLTPTFDLSKYLAPIIEYYRWYANSRGGNAGNDAWLVQIRDSGSSNWVTVDSTYQADYDWRRRIFQVQDYVNTTKAVQMRFVAADQLIAGDPNDGQSVVEAAVDDFFIYDREPISVNEVQAVKAKIHPNPADQTLLISLQNGIDAKATLYNVAGQAVGELILQSSITSYRLQTAQLPSGQYNLVIQSENSIQSSKVIIQHK